MKLDHLKEKKELVAAALIAISVLSAVLIVVKVTGFFLISANAQSTVEKAIDQSKPDDKNVTARSGEFKKVADALKKQNLFAPPAPRRHPVNTVLGIFGDEALINGKWYKAGARVADAEVLAVNPTSVTVEWDGKTKVFSPIDADGSSGPSGPSRPGKSVVSRGPGSASKGSPQMVVTKSGSGMKSPSGDSPMVKKMSETYKSMSDTQRETFKRVMQARAEQYKQMSDTERANFKAHIIERIGGSGGRISVELKSR